MARPARTVAALVGAGLLFGVSFCAYNFLSAETRVRGLCPQITPGQPVAELRAFALSHGLHPEPHEDGVNFLMESRTFGRFGCKVTLQRGLVLQSEYTFSD